MSRARELAKLANPEVFSVDSVNNVGLNSLTPDAKLDVIGVVSATSFSGDGSQLTGIIAGATLSPSNGTQRLVVTSQTTGSMTEVGTNSDITYDTGTNTISATQFSGSLLGNATGLQGTPSITVQDITAETVSIGGTLSYEDVSNINSVGIITANKGINVPDYGMTVTGVVTATSYVGDGSGLSGVESGVSNFVASGTIPNGSTVIINTDGTVGVVTATGSPSPSVGTPVTYNTVDTNEVSSTYDSNSNKVIVAYSDEGNSDYGTAIVGTVSGTSISFGTPVVFKSSAVSWITATFDSTNNKVAITYLNSVGNNTLTKVGNVSGTSISFPGSETLVDQANNTSSVYDSTHDKVVIVYRDFSDNSHGKAISGSYTNDYIGYGNPSTYNTNNTSDTTCTFDSTTGQVIITFKNSSNQGVSVVGDFSGNTPSYGSLNQHISANVSLIFGPTSSAYDPVNQKVVLTYGDGSNSYIKLGTVSGTSVSFGSPIQYDSTNHKSSVVYDSTSGKVAISWWDNSNARVATSFGTISGNSMSFTTPVGTGTTTPSDHISSVYDSYNKKIVNSYCFQQGTPMLGQSFVVDPEYQVTNLTTENYIGLAAETIGSGATGKITTVGGINSGQTGLTTAQTYYVQNIGGIGLTASNPSVVAGTSVSDTEVLVWKS